MHPLNRRKRSNIGKGLLAGLIGGLVASWTMNQFQAAVSKIESKLSNSSQKGAQIHSGEDSEDATMKTAARLAKAVTGVCLSKKQKKKAGPIVHYTYGALAGGLYGAVAEMMPSTTAGFGTAYSTWLFVGGDEIAVPAFGLSKSPEETPLPDHAKALAAHLVYGLTTESVRKGLKAIL